ncbi:hypothetical protein T01_774 [Trichinella spiralis]|uniref:Uncharacterized protein n=1 Tax=Trichinella spiralis TaxID=6334 RepID=A0A0V1BWU1_TRISP|nr:hypothetical protein T01_774 [Trichinella spiralis]
MASEATENSDTAGQFSGLHRYRIICIIAHQSDVPDCGNAVKICSFVVNIKRSYPSLLDSKCCATSHRVVVSPLKETDRIPDGASCCLTCNDHCISMCKDECDRLVGTHHFKKTDNRLTPGTEIDARLHSTCNTAHFRPKPPISTD